MNKHLIAAGLSVGILASGAAALVSPSVSGAVEDASTTTSASSTVARPNRSARHTEALKPLVTAGTINQAQSDAVVTALAAMPDGGRGGRSGHGSSAAATALGMTQDELRTALAGGQTVAALAKTKGVDVATIVAAILADAKAHFAAEVASGEHTQAEVDAKLTQATQRATDFVNGVAPVRGGKGRGGHRGQTPAVPATTANA